MARSLRNWRVSTGERMLCRRRAGPGAFPRTRAMVIGSLSASFEMLRYEMVVRIPPPPGVNDHPIGFEQAVRFALDGV